MHFNEIREVRPLCEAPSYEELVREFSLENLGTFIGDGIGEGKLEKTLEEEFSEGVFYDEYPGDPTTTKSTVDGIFYDEFIGDGIGESDMASQTKK